MDPLPPSSDISAKTSRLAADFLSSLGSVFNTNTPDAGLFASFLAQEQGTSPVQTSPKADASVPSTQQDAGSHNIGGRLPSGGMSLTTLKHLIFGLRHVLDKLNGHGGGKAPQNQPQADNVNPPSADVVASSNNQQLRIQSAATDNSILPSVTASASAEAPSSVTGASSDDSSSGDSNAADSRTLTDILASFLQLLQMIEKKLETVQAGGNVTVAITPTDATAQTQNAAVAGNDNTGAADQTSGGNQSSAADPLARLLALMQLVEQRLAAATNGEPAPADTTAPTSGTSGPVLPDIAHLQKDLRALLASLQNASINDDANTGSPADTAAGARPSGSITLATASSLLKTTDQPSSVKPVAVAMDDVLKLFGNTVNDSSNTPVFAPFSVNGLVAGADGKGGAALDMNSQSGDPANAGGLTSNNTALSGLAEGTRLADPYGFASQLSAARATSGGATGLPGAVEQVLLQLNRGVKGGNDQMTIQLQPAELGKISIKLDISSDGKVQGTVVANNPATLDLLLKDVRSLERALQEAGLRADPGSLQFSLGGQSGNTPGQTPGDLASNSSLKGNALSDGMGTLLDVSADASETWYLTPGRVNFKV